MAALEAPVAIGDVPGWPEPAHLPGSRRSQRPCSAAAGSPAEPASSRGGSPSVVQTGDQLLFWAQQRTAPATQQPSASPSGRPPDMRPRSGCPPHGCKAICGARPYMEDAYTAIPFLLEVPVNSGPPEDLIPPRIAPKVRSVSGCLPDSVNADTPRQAASLPSQLPFSHAASRAGQSPLARGIQSIPEMSPLHFFGVFDGHGGAEAALLCARTLHERLAEALGTERSAQQPASRRHSRSQSSSSSCTQVSVRSGCDGGQHSNDSGDSGISLSTSTDMDVEETAAASPAGLPYSANAFEQAFTEAFSKVDEEFGKDKDAGQVGTTAVVALVGDRQLYVGNCGDSRAVLCRAGLAIPLTEDHKAARDDETARVEGLGGEIMWWNGERVMGVLAVSRAIGDHFLRPFVIAKPEVTILSRSDDDELLLLASDGLWDVMTNQDACSLAQRCLRRAQQRGANRQTAARVAASVLTRAAIDQGSGDNVTVVVVDLSRPKDNVAVTAEGFTRDADDAGPPSRSQELEACHTTGTLPAAQAPAS